jgi:hypothetical protein
LFRLDVIQEVIISVISVTGWILCLVMCLKKINS